MTVTPASVGKQKPEKRCSSSWALLSKVYQVDPLQCRTCGGPLQIVADIVDGLSIRRILDHLGLSLPEEKPPPEVAEWCGCRWTTKGEEIGITA